MIIFARYRALAFFGQILNFSKVSKNHYYKIPNPTTTKFLIPPFSNKNSQYHQKSQIVGCWTSFLIPPSQNSLVHHFGKKIPILPRFAIPITTKFHHQPQEIPSYCLSRYKLCNYSEISTQWSFVLNLTFFFKLRTVTHIMPIFSHILTLPTRVWKLASVGI